MIPLVTASEVGIAQSLNLWRVFVNELQFCERVLRVGALRLNLLEHSTQEGDSPVQREEQWPAITYYRLVESSCLGVQLKIGGKFHLKLNMGERPIANKYREGKMKSTLKRELKALEIVKREAIGTSRIYYLVFNQLILVRVVWFLCEVAIV